MLFDTHVLSQIRHKKSKKSEQYATSVPVYSCDLSRTLLSKIAEMFASLKRTHVG